MDNHCKDARGKKEDECGMAAFGRLFLEEKMFSFISQRCTEVERAAVFAELGSPILNLVTVNDERIFKAVCRYMRLLQKTLQWLSTTCEKKENTAGRIKKQNKKLELW